jgi:ferredoxin-NADP reductase
MEGHIVKILNIDKVTHNVKRFQVEKPAGYLFVPGQATEVSINIPVFYKKFYLCGPPPMMDAVLRHLVNLGVGENLITMEKM